MLTRGSKNLIITVVALLALFGIFSVYQVQKLNKAHSTFENYYTFRGCAKLVSKTDDAGACETKSGQTIKIVKFDGKWYLDGDLPCGFLCF
jgi:hypothetical protein